MPVPQECLRTRCCVVGGGPAGIMLGYLLARAGVPVTVLEKHKDFFRDFRGDTVHPATLQVLHELGLLDRFLKVPHQKVESAGALVGDFSFRAADFRHVPSAAKFVALMPQWDFLNFLSGEAKQFPMFDLRMNYEVGDLIRDGERITGVVGRSAEGASFEVSADLVVGCDGRHAITRSAGQLQLIELGVPIDVLWFRVSRRFGDPEQVLGTFNYGKGLILINRGEYFQAGLIIRKGSFEELKGQGLDNLQHSLRELAPYLGQRVEELHDWDQFKLLTVQINRLRRWYRQGLLCIGDAAHAMSPAGGVGINLAIQDAVATANLLTGPLQNGGITATDLQAVQCRREFPTRVTQAVQLRIHEGFARGFESTGPTEVPWFFKLATQIPGVQRVLGYAVGMGVRPEHVKARPLRASSNHALKLAAGTAVGLAVALIVLRRRF